MISLQILYRDMQIRPRQQPLASPQRHLQIKNKGILYRVGLSRYLCSRLAADVSCVINIQVMLLCIFIIMIDFAFLASSERNSYLSIFIQNIVFLLSMLIWLLLNRQHTPLFNIISLSAAIAYMAIATALYSKELPYQTVVAGIFTTAEIIIGVIYLQKKQYTFVIAALGLQLILITLQADSKINTSWVVVLIITIGIIIVSLAIGLIFLIFSIAEVFKRDGVRLIAIETLYIGLTHVGYALIAGFIFMRLQFNTPTIIVAMPCLVFQVILLLITSLFKTEIVLFQSDAVIIQQDGFRNHKVQFERIEEENKLYKISSNFYTLHNKYNNDRPTSLLDVIVQPSAEESACVICLTDRASLVWLPCGHLSVCEGCGKYLMESNKVACVMCKSKCEWIAHLKDEIRGAQTKSDFCYRIKEK